MQKYVLVTGASTGIGRAIAVCLAKSGWQVFAGVRSEKAAAELRTLHDALRPVTLDITSAEQIAAAVKTIEAQIGSDAGLDGLVNNAGIAVAGPIEFLSVDDIRRSLEVNIVGQIAVIKACLPLIRKGHGRIVQVTSGARNFPMPFLGAYVASKSGMGVIVDALRRELRSSKIPVSEVLPGIVTTPMWDKYRSPADQLQKSMPEYAQSQAQTFTKGRKLFDLLMRHGAAPEKTARAVLHALESNRPRIRYPVGLDARFGLLVPRITPVRLMDWFVALALR